MACNFPNQINNRNFLSPVGFKFTLSKNPKIPFFCNSARIPEISLGSAIQPTYLKDLDVPGDRLSYGDFSLRFLVDENMEKAAVGSLMILNTSRPAILPASFVACL